jgi:hypothetical protein
MEALMAVLRGRKITDPSGISIDIRAALVTVCLLLSAWLAPAAWAQGDLFTVRDVPVDVTAKSAVAAREQAIAQGHRDALDQLFRRLVPAEQWRDIPQLPLQDIFALAVNFSVADERTSDVRYIADFTVRFLGAEVQAYLRRNNIAFAVTRSDPVLVLPVWTDDLGSRVWLDSPWYEFWLWNASDEGLVPLLVPLGDLQDMSSISAGGALSLNASMLTPLIERYNAGDLIVTEARLQGSPEEGSARLITTSLQFSGAGAARLGEVFDQREGEELEDLMARAAGSLNGEIQEAWKQNNLIAYGNLRAIFVMAYTPDLASWTEIRDRLRRVAAIEQVKILSVSKSGSGLDISFAGTEQQLSLAMSRDDLRLALNADSGWELSLSEVAQPFPNKEKVGAGPRFPGFSGGEPEPGEHSPPDMLEGSAEPPLGAPNALGDDVAQ